MSAPAERLGARDNIAAGIVLILASVMMLTTLDAAAKYVAERYPLLQVVFLRSLFGVIPVLAVVAVQRQWAQLRPRAFAGHAVRGTLSLVAMGLFFASLQVMSLPDATALFFVAPLLMTALSVPLLKEKVGARRWGAIVVGLAGVLVIVRPGSGVFGWPALLPMGAALAYSLIVICTRFVGRTETAPAMALWYTVVPIAVSGAAMPWLWVPPAAEHWPVFLATGLLGGSGILLMSFAYRVAPVGAMAPFDYTALLWAALWGWLIWEDLPDAWTIAGACVIAGSGLYIIHRETRLGPSRA
ncbi:MAG: DMT family transporter [Alphaproteobacteria bacterium]